MIEKPPSGVRHKSSGRAHTGVYASRAVRVKCGRKPYNATAPISASPQPDERGLIWPLLTRVPQERERDRLAWLSWDEGYRRGQGSQAVDPAVGAETAAWLNHIIASAWGGAGKASPGGKRGASDETGVRDSNGCSYTGIFASDGLSSFVAEYVDRIY